MVTTREHALWMTQTMYDCLQEAGDDVEAGLAAAEYILATQPFPDDIDAALAVRHAPAGYTREKPLIIGGKQFVGGEFIPDEAWAKATLKEKAQVDPTFVSKTAISVERRDEAGRRGNKRSGVFYSPQDESMPEYGDIVNRAAIRPGTKLFVGTSSIEFAEHAGVKDKPLPRDLVKEYNVKTLADAEEKNAEGELDTDSFYDLFQTVARRVLEGRGFQGAHWLEEEDLSPQQYQVWDESAIQATPEEKAQVEGNSITDARTEIEEELQKLGGRRWTKEVATKVVSTLSAAVGEQIQVVGSVAKLGQSFHDVDVLRPGVHDWSGHPNPNISDAMQKMGFEYTGQSVRGPKDQKMKGKTFAKDWSELHHFEHRSTGHKFEIWTILTPPKEHTLSLDAFFAHDIANRHAQGILNRSLKAARGLSADARKELETALKRDVRDSGEAILTFIEKYRLQLAKLLSATQLASLLEGAREVAANVPTLATFPGTIPPPPTLEPKTAVALVERLEELTGEKRAEAIYNLPANQQTYVQQALAAKEASPPIIPPTFTPPSPPPGAPEGIHFPVIEEAVKQLAEKNVMTRDRFDALDAASRAKAFTVAGVDAQGTLTKIRDSLVENVREGVDYETWREKVLEDVEPGTFLSEGHMETVFRTVVQTQFSDGRETVLNHPLIRSGFPYRARDAIHDERVRENHLALEKMGIQGTNIYRADDPVWQLFRVPWDYNDRCSDIAMTVRQAAEAGIEEAQQWLDTGIEPSPPAHVPMPPFVPPPGFQRAVASMPLSIQLSMQSIEAFSTDVQGHEHRSKGPGGGRFVSKGKGGSNRGEGGKSGSTKKAMSPEEVQRLAYSSVETEIDEYKRIGMTPSQANDGDCLTATREIIKRIEDGGGSAFYAQPKDGPYHVWVYAGGKHYDVETPGGVNLPSNLPYFKRNPDQYSPWVNADRQWRIANKDTQLGIALSVSSDDYPRDNANRFLDKHNIVKAANESETAAAMRESLPEDQRWKLDRVVMHLQSGGAVHHPKEPPGLSININGAIIDPVWAEYSRAEVAYKEWADRQACRDECRKAADKVITAVRSGRKELDEVEANLKDAGATGAEMRAVSRVRHLVDTEKRPPEALEELYENVAEAVHCRIDASCAIDPEPIKPEEPGP